MNKIRKIDLVYCMAFSLFVISRILSHTSYEIPVGIKHAMTLISTLIVVLKIVLYDKLTLKEMCVYGAVVGIASISTISSKEYELLCSIIFIVGAKNVLFDLIAKSYRFVASTLMGTTFILSVMGLLKENLFYRGEVLRRTFGYSYPTDFVAMIFYILLADWFLCITHKKSLTARIMVYAVVAVLTLLFCDSRLGSLFIALLIPVSLMSKYLFNEKKKNALLFFFEKYSIVICAMISTLLVNLYMKYPSSSILHTLDAISSFRITLTAWAVKMFGYPLWGKDIYTEYLATNNTQWFFIDNSYYVMFIQYGVILSIVILILFTLNNKKMLLKGDDIIPIVFCLIALNSIVGQQFFLLEYNIFLLTLRANIQQKRDQKNEVEKIATKKRIFKWI